MKYESNYLCHYGVKGMKWGVRHAPQPLGNTRRGQSSRNMTAEERKKAERNKKIKRAAIIGGAAIATGLAVYGGYKLKQNSDKKTIEAGLNYIKSNPNFDDNDYKHFSSLSAKDAKSYLKDRTNSVSDIRKNWTNAALDKSRKQAEAVEKSESLRKAQNAYLARNASLGGKNVGSARGAIGKAPTVGKNVTEAQKRRTWNAYQSAKNTESQLKAARRQGVTGLDSKIKKAEKAVNQRHVDVDKVFFSPNGKAPASFLKSYNPTPKRATASNSGLSAWKRAQSDNKSLLDKQLADTISGLPVKRRRKR